MSLSNRSFYHPFNRSIDGIMRDFEHMDRGFTPYWRDNMRFDIGNELNEVVDNDENFKVSIDVSHFKPEELKVNVDSRVLSVEAKQELKDGSNYFRRSFTRKWTLPEDVDFTAIKSSINNEGKLCIDAPKNGKMSVRSIPIEHVLLGSSS